ncbi:hypothetical protein MSAN_00142300 [Mycena sanguinolenta]|uniref:Uncharacterized protein n=1 Tax=Mycena sanguinolenta TaxID=230812 RepID=A0A8H6ZH35_9AGAR|nr:hypothetical protein MSAN_00142300 [Mycena sanguinolenta]
MPYAPLSSGGKRPAVVIYHTPAEFGIADPCSAESPPMHSRSGFLTRLVTVILHIGLVGVHLAILVIASKQLEHNITFSLGLQSTVSFWTTAISTAIGTVVYCSCLVFISQKLAMQSGAGSRSLTAVHDSISSWRGFGSALSVLHNQVALPASVLQSLIVVGYLGAISILHITIPATFSAETFDTLISLDVPTVGLPDYNASYINSSYDFTSAFPSRFLPWFGNLQDSQTVGLFNGTLYEVLQGPNLGPGIANVSAAAINMSCGYIPSENIKVIDWHPFQFAISLPTIGLDESEWPIYSPLSARANMVQILSDLRLNNSAILWTTLKVQDSSGNIGNPVIVDGAMDMNNATINQLQVLQCSKSVAAQFALVNTQTKRVNSSSIYPDIYKTESRWESCLNLNLTADNSTLLGSNAWAESLDLGYDISNFFSIIEENLMEYLNLDPLNSRVNSLKLHDIENGLSSLVATTFWIAGHIPPDAMTMQSLVPPVLATGTTTAQQVTTLVRLNISQFAVWCGLGTSVILLIFSTWSIGSIREPGGISVGPGILRVVWWAQENAEDIDFLKNVCQPSELNLRTAALDVIPEESASKCLKPEYGSSERSGSTMNWPQIIGIILHILLVLVHAIVLWIRATNRDYQIVFRLGLQGVISLWLTHGLGSGSSMATLYQQLSLPVSVSRTLAIFGYLSVISALHVTTPALISVEAFNSTVSSQVVIEGLPQWPESDHNATISYFQKDAEFLEYLGALDLSQTVGLFNGTLYDTLTDVYGNSRLMNASATGFEVTCGYLPGAATVTDAANSWVNVSFGQFGWTQVVVPGPDVVTLTAMYPWSGLQDPGLLNSIIVYTTNEVLDSAGNSGSPVDVPQGEFATSVHQLQFLQCRRYLVSQSAQVDPGSRTIVPDTLDPVVYKTQSIWLSSADLPATTDSGSSLINSSSWATILSAIQQDGVLIGNLYPTWGDAFIMEQLGLRPDVGDSGGVTNRTLYLYEIENALSNLIASVFWIAGNIRPPPLTMKYGFSNGSVGAITANVQKPPILEQKTTTLTQTVPAARLHVSPLAASIGLAGSVILLVLAVTVCGTSIRTPPSCLQSVGFLQTLWVYRHHPDLWEIIDHLEEPTDRDLRVTGLMNVRLLDAESTQQIGVS